MTIVEYESDMVNKSIGKRTVEKHLYVTSLPTRTSKAACNLDTIHRIIYTVFSIWRRLRKNKTDRRK